MKVLVTGGLGYLGSVVTSKLVEEGYDTRVLDSALYGNHLDKSLNYELIQGDIMDVNIQSKALKGVENVIHLAAIVGEPAGNIDKELTIKVNYFATRRLAELCAKKNVKMIFSSTCSVYGVKPDGLLTESSEVYPLSIYAISKLVAEEVIEKMNHNSTIFRLGTLFGYSPRMRFDLVTNLFIAQAISGKGITVFGGSQYRPFVHVEDVADVFIRALNSEIKGIFNLGGKNYEIIDVANTLKKITGCEVTVLKEIKDPRNYMVDSSLAMDTFKVKFNRNIGHALDEIKDAFERGLIEGYQQPIYSNEKSLRRKLV